jgi:hypothetical protein
MCYGTGTGLQGCKGNLCRCELSSRRTGLYVGMASEDGYIVSGEGCGPWI